MEEKKILFLVIFTIACLFLVFLLLPVFNIPSPLNTSLFTKQSKEVNKTASLLLVFPDKKRAFEGEVVDGTTVSDVLLASAQAGNFSFDYKNGYVIDGLGGGGNKEWKCFLNNDLVEFSFADKKVVNKGDKIKCIYE